MKELRADNKERYLARIVRLRGESTMARRQGLVKVVEENSRKERLTLRSGVVYKAKDAFIARMLSQGVKKDMAKATWAKSVADDSVRKRTNSSGQSTCPIELDFEVTRTQEWARKKCRRLTRVESDPKDLDDAGVVDIEEQEDLPDNAAMASSDKHMKVLAIMNEGAAESAPKLSDVLLDFDMLLPAEDLVLAMC